MTAQAALDDVRAFGAAANAGQRADVLAAQRAARDAREVAPVQDALFGTCGEAQPELFEVNRVTAPAVKRGDRFEHARQLDTTWRPGPGERYADAPHAVMVVTAVTRRRVYYRCVDGGPSWCSSPPAFEAVVSRWLP